MYGQYLYRTIKLKKLRHHQQALKFKIKIWGGASHQTANALFGIGNI
jgi:hypothetical protein